MSQKITQPIRLYRHLLRCVRKLPKEAQSHYQHHVRQVCLRVVEIIYTDCFLYLDCVRRFCLHLKNRLASNVTFRSGHYLQAAVLCPDWPTFNSDQASLTGSEQLQRNSSLIRNRRRSADA